MYLCNTPVAVRVSYILVVALVLNRIIPQHIICGNIICCAGTEACFTAALLLLYCT